MEYCGDFGSSMSQHSWIGQQGDISRPDEFPLVRETVSEQRDHQLFDERSASGDNHQTFDKTEQVFDTMPNHTYPQQDHPCHYHQFAHTSPYPPPYYHPSPYFSPYHPPHPLPNCFTQTLYPHSALPPTTYPPYQGACVSTFPSWHPQLLVQQEGTTEHAPLQFHSRPTETVQPCAIQGAPAVPNCQVLDCALDMECQQVLGVHATSNETDCLTKNEGQPHHGIETQSISDMLDQIQAQLKTISENLSQNLKRMNSWESKKSVATQAAAVAPVCCSKTNNTAGSETMLVHNLQESMIVQDYHNGAMKMHVSVEVKQESEQLDKCLHKASATASHEQVRIWKQQCDLEINTGCSLKLDTKTCIIEFSDATSSLPFQQEQLQQVHTQEYNLMLTAKGIQEWDPGIGTPSSMYLWLQGLTARIKTDKPLSWLQISELATGQSRVTCASYVWDPGTMLPRYKSKWWFLLTEEKVMFGLIPEQWSFWCYVTHYCQISEKCIAISSQLYWHEDINFNEKHLWLIQFQPP